MQTFEINYYDVSATHPDLNYTVNFLLPEKASHRPAVRQFLKGLYHEPFTHLAFKKILDYKKNPNVVHAGAFFGDMLHTLSENAAMVFAFEPVLENYFFAKKNAGRLGLKNVTLFNAGLGAENGILPIKTVGRYGRYIGGGATFDFAPDEAAADSYEYAPVFRIDDLPIRDVGLIELDVEGYELQALTGGRRLIEANAPVLMIEDNKRNCAAFMAELGYVHCFETKDIQFWATGDDIAFVKSLEPVGQ